MRATFDIRRLHTSLNAWTVFPDGRQCSECHCCSLLWASIHIF